MWLALNQLCGLHSHNPAIIIIKFIYQVSKKGGAIAPLAPPAYATERDRQLLAFSSTHRQRVVCFSTWINRSEAKRTGYLGYTASHKAATWPLMIFKAAQ